MVGAGRSFVIRICGTDWRSLSIMQAVVDEVWIGTEGVQKVGGNCQD